MSRRLIVFVAIGLIAAAGAGAWWTLGPQQPARRADPTDAAQVARGEPLYAEHCAECHGPELGGEPNWRQRNPDGTLPAPPHDETGHTWHHPDSLLFDYTKRGGAAVAPEGFQSAMPGFGDVLSDAEIWAVLAYIKSRWPAEVRARQAEISGG